MIIDSHCHLGIDTVYDFQVTEEMLIRNCQEFNLYGAIVQPCITRPYLADIREAHNRIYRFCQEHSGCFWGMVSMNPHFNNDDYSNEVKRCVEDLGFVGVKLTPNGHAVDLMSEDARKVFNVARDLRVPVMVHTGMGIPFADPARLYPLISDYSDVKIIIAHGGSDFFAAQAMFLAETFEHVYIEPSGIGVEGIDMFLKNLSPKKLMFSTDLPINTASEILKYKQVVNDELALRQIFSLTAIEVFNLRLKY
ncbi:amidohydrolase family protein [Petroclostridium sp. X23]|uniref:amidohydrolase family protein n=1 Tax=Petroclostridium sp. X23 TaxID=3045146 RepID=UPI0024AD6B17|nr:amidohydrolase family protein [Petroclostridium sp. X23]WHH58009.1 TatD family hydrolase [Petroclostridium sp. X23]